MSYSQNVKGGLLKKMYPYSPFQNKRMQNVEIVWESSQKFPPTSEPEKSHNHVSVHFLKKWKHDWSPEVSQWRTIQQK